MPPRNPITSGMPPPEAASAAPVSAKSDVNGRLACHGENSIECSGLAADAENEASVKTREDQHDRETIDPISWVARLAIAG